MPAADPGGAPGVCLDKGYDFETVRAKVEAYGYTAHLRTLGQEATDSERRRAIAPADESWSAPTPG